MVLNPITRKRIKNFVQIKRAYYSLWILIILYVISLGANLFANNHPYVVKFKGEYYFPLLFNYSKKHFYPDGDTTVVNYKHLQKQEFFKNDPSHKMIFPLIPFGSQENVDTKDLNVPQYLIIKVEKEAEIASLDLRSDDTVRRFRGGELFVENAREWEDKPIQEFLKFGPQLQENIKKRFANQAAPAFKTEINLGEHLVLLEINEYVPENREPNKIRLNIQMVRDKKKKVAYEEEAVYDLDLLPKQKPHPIMAVLTAEDRIKVEEKLKARKENFVDPLFVEVNKLPYRISFLKNDISYPFKPVGRHWFGLDSSGRDVLTQIIYAFRISITFGLFLVVITLVLGVIIGAIQGYFGGVVDLAGQRLIEIWAAMPFLYIMILIGDSFGRNFWLLLFVYGIFNWIGVSSYMRAEFLKLRKTSYVEAAKCMGISDFKIMYRHILPNALVPIITLLPFLLVGAIGSLAALDYLGFGLPVLTPSFGQLLDQAQATPKAWWLILFPSLALLITMLLGTLIGDGLRAAFDPRKFHKIE